MDEKPANKFAPRVTKLVNLNRFRKFDKPPAEGNYCMLNVRLIGNGKVRFSVSKPDKSNYGASLYPFEYEPVMETIIQPMADAIKKGESFTDDCEYFIRNEFVNFNTKQREIVEFRTGQRDKIPYISLRNQTDTITFTFAAINETKIKVGDKIIENESVAQLYFISYWASLISTVRNLFEEMEIGDIVTLDNNTEEAPVGVI